MAMMKEAIFTIEFGVDGRVYTGSAMSVEISEERSVGDVFLFEGDLSTFRPGPRTWEVKLRGIGPLTVSESGKFTDNLKQGTSAAQKWICPYCGRAWPRVRHKCWDGVDGCGAPRPVMWWI